jgi:lactoylglutathione lyase
MNTTHDTRSPIDPAARNAAPLGVVLHVDDIAAASRFYQQLGFSETGVFPRSDGTIVLAILTYGASTLLLGRKDELHYENDARAQKIRRGPPGLGAVITLLVSDLDRVYGVVKAAGLEVLLEPVVEFYGDRVFMFLDPNGYEWKVSQTVAEVGRSEVESIIASS